MAAPRKTAVEPDVEPIEVGGEAPTTNAYAAFVKAQSEIGNVGKTAYNPGFKSKFVNLESAANAIIPVLNNNGFGVMQGVNYIDGTPCLDTTLIYHDGTRLGGYSYPLVSKDMNDPQKVGGSLTYARRYSLMAIVGSAPEDDDGNAAATPAPKKETALKKLKDQMIAMKADSAKFKELASKAKVNAEKYADLNEEQAQKILDAMDSSVPF